MPPPNGRALPVLARAHGDPFIWAEYRTGAAAVDERNMSESGVYAVIVPAFVVIVDSVVEPPVTRFVVVVVVVVSCASAMPSATTKGAPATNIFANLVCFIFVPPCFD
jgi:hypothetical protein